MANTKTNKNQKVSAVKDQVVENKKENEEVEALKAQLEEMKKAMAQLLNTQQEKSQKIVVKEQEDEVIIGCRLLQGIGWGDKTDSAGEIRLAYGEEQSVPVSDMKKFFRKTAIRRLFEDGLCYFADPESYALFNIKKHIDLSDEAIIEMLSNKDANAIVRKLSEITTDKKDSAIVNCLVYRISDMIRKRKLNLDYYTRMAVERYLGVEFDRCIASLVAIDRIKA